MAPDQRADLADRQAATDRATGLADAALAAAARALAAARAAGGSLDRLGGVPVPGVVGFADLGARLAPGGPVVPPPLPADRSPGPVASWWGGLSAAQQRAVVATHPAEVGSLDGLPGWARDLANRRLLDVALRALPPDDPQHAMAAVVAAEVARHEEGGQPVQLLQFDPPGDLVALSLGDIDTAAAVALLVPGILTTPADDLPALTADAADVRAAAVTAAPGLAVATVAWLGYRTPGTWATAPSAQLARKGGPALDRALDGLAASRAAPGSAPVPRTTVLAHSYGTLVASRAAQAPGRLAADALVLLGSPGTEALTARSLEAREVYGAWTPADPISLCDWFGPGPVDPWFGDVELPTDRTQGHTQYYDTDRPTLAAIGEVVAGTRRAG
jgi:Alpha/beta hydrolase